MKAICQHYRRIDFFREIEQTTNKKSTYIMMYEIFIYIVVNVTAGLKYNIWG